MKRIILLFTVLAMIVSPVNIIPESNKNYNIIAVDYRASTYSDAVSLIYTIIEFFSDDSIEDSSLDINENGSIDAVDLAIARRMAIKKAGHVETERKYLIEPADLPLDIIYSGSEYEIIQTYIDYNPETRVRKVGFGGGVYYYYHTIKKPLDDIGLSRQEIETFITEDEYKKYLENKLGTTIYKTRYQFYIGETYVCVDVFAEELDGLIFAEVEFDSIEKALNFQPPDWFGEDVTSDSRYKNANLSKNGLPK